MSFNSKQEKKTRKRKEYDSSGSSGSSDHASLKANNKSNNLNSQMRELLAIQKRAISRVSNTKFRHVRKRKPYKNNISIRRAKLFKYFSNPYGYLTVPVMMNSINLLYNFTDEERAKLEDLLTKQEINTPQLINILEKKEDETQSLDNILIDVLNLKLLTPKSDTAQQNTPVLQHKKTRSNTKELQQLLNDLYDLKHPAPTTNNEVLRPTNNELRLTNNELRLYNNADRNRQASVEPLEPLQNTITSKKQQQLEAEISNLQLQLREALEAKIKKLELQIKQSLDESNPKLN